MDLTPELYSKVIQYINGELSRSRLEDWLVPHLEKLLSPASPGSHELVGELELGLAEFSHGDITEGELQESLRNFLQYRVMFVHLREDLNDVSTGSEATIASFSVTPSVTPMTFSPWQAPTEPLSLSETEHREVEFAGI